MSDRLVTVVPAGPPERGFRIPPPPPDHPMHGKPRAGFVGDYRPLDERLADPRAPKDP